MSFFGNNDNIEKLATNLTTQAYLKSVNTYVKNNPTPVGTYQPQHNINNNNPPSRKISRRNISNVTPSISSQKQLQTPKKQIITQPSQYQNKNQSQNPMSNTNTQPSQTSARKPRRSVGNFSIKQHQKQVNVVNTPPQNQRTNRIPQAMLTYNSNVSGSATRLSNEERRLRSQRTEQILAKYKRDPVKLGKQITDPGIQQKQKQQVVTIRINNNNWSSRQIPYLQTKKQNVLIYKTDKQSFNKNPNVAHIFQPVQQKEQKKPIQSNSNTNIYNNSNYANKPILRVKKVQQQSPNSKNKISIQEKQINNFHTDSNINANNNVHTNPSINNNTNIRSNIICFIVKRLYNQKLQQNFSQITHYAEKNKLKQNKYIRMFINKLSNLEQNSNLYQHRIAFTKMVKYNPSQVKSSHSLPHSKSYQKHAVTIQTLQQQSKSYLPYLLHRLSKATISQTLIRLKKYKKTKKRSALENKLSFILAKLFENKKRLYFTKFYSQLNEIQYHKISSLVNATQILRHYRARIFSKFIRNLVIAYQNKKNLQQNSNTQTETIRSSPKKSLRADRSQSSLISVSSPKSQKQKQMNQTNKGSMRIKNTSNNIISRLEQKYIQNSNKLRQVRNMVRIKTQQLTQSLQNLKKSNSQLQNLTSQKQKFQQQLKQKAESIQFPQQDYIQTSQLLLDTKFPILYDIYIKLQKSPLQQINISQLYALYPNIQEEIAKDTLVAQWIELGNNMWLRGQIDKYQGSLEVERKAAKLAFQEQVNVLQLIKGYIKERYTWQWVRNALNNVVSTN